MKIALATDHAGFSIKEKLRKELAELGHEVNDFGTFSEEPVDYVDFGIKAARAVASGDCERGILLCGSGIGMSITANKVKGIRAANCYSVEAALLSREHNDANVLCIGSRLNDWRSIVAMTRAWLQADFSGGRHGRRVEKIKDIENRLFR